MKHKLLIGGAIAAALTIAVNPFSQYPACSDGAGGVIISKDKRAGRFAMMLHGSPRHGRREFTLRHADGSRCRVPVPAEVYAEHEVGEIFTR